MDLDAILLGLLRDDGSGYDLAGRLRSASHYWHAELSQIYPALRRLESRGLLTSRSRVGHRGPRRRIYAITDAGRRALVDALDDPERGSGTRSECSEKLPWLARVRFLAAADASTARGAIESVAIALLQERARLISERERLASQPLHDDPREAFFENAALDAALSTTEARLQWCERTLVALPELGAPASRAASDARPATDVASDASDDRTSATPREGGPGPTRS
ncbi:MAG: PadR family transcriptional regulator [Planctomycetes bacterium]|nr:PadR family transcriptional regulator [Planctomycetota bacterium]